MVNKVVKKNFTEHLKIIEKKFLIPIVTLLLNPLFLKFGIRGLMNNIQVKFNNNSNYTSNDNNIRVKCKKIKLKLKLNLLNKV